MHRLFVALSLPEPLRDLLVDTMDPLPGLHWQDADRLHVTLRFVGEVERPTAEDLALALATVRTRPFSLRVAGVGRFEHRQRGVLWAALEPRQEITALAARIERACIGVGLPLERRAFHPHITLAKWDRSGRDEVAPFLARHASLASDPFTMNAFQLFESHLGRLRAHHEVIADFPFA